jgi:hypothetical protein
MDQNYKEMLSYDEALCIVQMCIHELQVRFLPQQPNFIIKCLNYNSTKDASMIQTISCGVDPMDN